METIGRVLSEKSVGTGARNQHPQHPGAVPVGHPGLGRPERPHHQHTAEGEDPAKRPAQPGRLPHGDRHPAQQKDLRDAQHATDQDGNRRQRQQHRTVLPPGPGEEIDHGEQRQGVGDSGLHRLVEDSGEPTVVQGQQRHALPVQRDPAPEGAQYRSQVGDQTEHRHEGVEHHEYDEHPTEPVECLRPVIAAAQPAADHEQHGDRIEIVVHTGQKRTRREVTENRHTDRVEGDERGE